MLDRLSDLVSTIVVIIVLATFLDLLIPEGSIKKYVKLFIGLLILLTILNPIVSLLDSEMANRPEEFFEVNEQGKTSEIIARGENLKEKDLEHIKGRYEITLKDEVSRIVENNFKKYDLFQLKASYNDKWGSDDFGDIYDLKIILEAREFERSKIEEKKGKIEEITPINIKVEEESDKEQESKKDIHEGEIVSLPEYKKENKKNLISELSDRLYLSPNNIEVKVKRR